MGALAWAIRRATATDAELLVVTAYDEPLPTAGALGAGVPIVYFGNTRERVSSWQSSVLEEAVESSGCDVGIRRIVGAGSPASLLLSAALGADLLVLGSSGGRWQPTLRRCLRRSTCPVVVIENGQVQ